MGQFDDQVAIITGGGGAVGLGIAMRLGQEGARIVLVEADRNSGEYAADQLDSEGIQGRLLIGDPADSSAAKWAVTTTTLVWGRLDILVHAASTPGIRGGISEVGLDALDATYRADVRAPLLFCCEAIPKMVEQSYGRIVTVASIAGKEGDPLRGARSSTQAASIGLTKAVAMSVADTGIRVNAVVTSHVEGMGSDGVHKDTSIGRGATIDEVVSAVCWVASKECSFSTGATFDVTGGRSSY